MILHLANDFAGSKVYRNLVEQLDQLGFGQIVYTPLKDESKIGLNNLQFIFPDSEIIYSPILNKTIDRILYKRKIRKIVKDVEVKVDMKKIKIIHAHTWYSDGGVAYELSKKYRIPYVVAVRSTDLNIFLKFFFHERKFGRQILVNSKKIVVISAIYKDRILNHPALLNIKGVVEKNIEVIPNGVDPFWIHNRVFQRKQVLNYQKIKLLYVGKFDKGKNISNLIDAINHLNKKKQQQFHLTLIGGKGTEEKKILKKIKNNTSFEYMGPIYSYPVLKSCYEKSDYFVMPSKAETFGLVFVEALLQGLPVLYTAKEGIDGFYDSSIGEKVDNTSVVEIEKKILRLVLRNDFDYNLSEIAENHNWENIAKKYMNIYSTI